MTQDNKSFSPLPKWVVGAAAPFWTEFQRQLRFAFLAAVLLAASAGSLPAQTGVIRVGHFPNITHAQGMIGHGLARSSTNSWFEKRLGRGVKVQWFVYHAGPQAMEAILARSLDLTYVGPNPAVNAHLRSRGEEIRIIAGACSGGSALVVQSDGRIRAPADFKGRRVATPQLGNTQDVAARAWLKENNLKVTLTGGDVFVVPTANPDQLALFQRGALDAVWTVEPWVSRLLLEAKGKLFLDERELWPDTKGEYVTTHLVARSNFLREQPALVKRWIAAHVELTDWMGENEAAAKQIFNDEFKAETTRAMAKPILDAAWARLRPTVDPVRKSLIKSAEHAHRAGLLPGRPELGRIYELGLLNEVLREKGREPIR